MNLRYLSIILALLTALAASAIDSPKHEMRGAWLATVYGIDWPSRTGTTPAIADQQRKELCAILDTLQEAGVNAVMLQVRSMADAMYASTLEPWSAYLTGTRGVAPAKGWDPLAFAVEEAHKRGMELHAWVNPFRVSNGAAPDAAPVACGSRTFDPASRGWLITQLEAAKKAAPPPPTRGKKGKRTPPRQPQPTPKVTIFDPGNREACAHVLEVCREIVTKYDVDGLVFDDYFYPDRLAEGAGYDVASWRAQAPEGMSQADWRRANVNRFIADVAAMLRTERPEVRFGVSPAGVAGGNGEATDRYGLKKPPVGSDWMYGRIYCDPLAWLAEGSVDYVSPQLYWATDHPTNPYEPLVLWWSDIASAFGRHCFMSQNVVAIDASPEAWDEQVAEISVNRRYADADAPGSLLYSCCNITGRKACGLAGRLAESVYAAPALMPPMTWREASNPGAVDGLRRSGSVLEWLPVTGQRYVVYAIPSDLSPLDALANNGTNFAPEFIAAVTYSPRYEIPAALRSGYTFAVACYDRFGNEWEAVFLKK